MVPSKILQDIITRIIAATRFPFINQEDWDEKRKTLVNTSLSKSYGVSTSTGVIYPSIVVLNPDDSIREIGEVEMKVVANLAEKWRDLSEKASIGDQYRKLFIYIPEGSEDLAIKILKENRIQYAGLRVWLIDDGVLKTKPISTPDMIKDHRVS
jgi:tRNA G37 N-methylase Trm5